jgi:hypothetical protein
MKLTKNQEEIIERALKIRLDCSYCSKTEAIKFHSFQLMEKGKLTYGEVNLILKTPLKTIEKVWKKMPKS